jgi:hypothetical protein
MRKQKKAGRKRKSEVLKVDQAIAALDADYQKRREKYSVFVESIQRLSGVEKAEAWLSYVSNNIDEFGDQEALIFLQSRGKNCAAQIKRLISWWKECEKRTLAASVGAIAIHNLDTGKSKRIATRTLAQVSKIETVSRFVLRDFWDRYRSQELSIDATMLRTVEWCGIGGFDAWWRRYAKEETRDMILGGADPVPLSFWLFNMCRSGYAMSLMPKALSAALDVLEISSDGEQYPWSFRREYDPGGMPPVDHVSFASTIVFAHHILRPNGTTSVLTAPAIDTLQRHQFEDGGWPCWADSEAKPDIESTAMAMHAIALHKPNGSQRVLEAGREYLLAHQDRGGHWTDPSAIDEVYLTVLVLDAIEMATGGTSLTFSPPNTFKGPLHTDKARVPCQEPRRFRVALSFPGEHREFVEPIAEKLAHKLGKPKVLYDKYHEAEFARPNLDVYLQSLYHDNSDLLVVFICADYERKDWCRLEWRAIRDLIKTHRPEDVMLVRLDQTAAVPGIFSIDGYIDAGGRSPDQVSTLILERLADT